MTVAPAIIPRSVAANSGMTGMRRYELPCSDSNSCSSFKRGYIKQAHLS